MLVNTKTNRLFKLILLLVFALLFNLETARAQDSAFTFQGKLAESGAAANGQYDLQFKLYDAPMSGTLLGTLARDDVQVTQGVFTVTLDYGAAVFLNNSGRYLEVAVRPGASSGAFTTIAPRQELTAAPYAVKSLTADTATNATNSIQLGGISASQYVVTADSRLSDARNPLPGSGSYVQNQTSVPQPADFSINGKGAANIFDAETQYNISGFRALASDVVRGNVFAGINAGILNTTGLANSFFGNFAGRSNTSASENSFFGSNAGFSNTTGASNSFFGNDAGRSNLIGNNNSFFGARVGMNNTGFNNSFFGTFAGTSNISGGDNSFFGTSAGGRNTSGRRNSFFGINAGANVETQQSNSFFGAGAGFNNLADGNSFFGDNAGFYNTTGVQNSFFGFNAGLNNTTGAANSFYGNAAGNANTTGASNSFFGNSAGNNNTVGSGNSFFGGSAGSFNTNGFANSFFGTSTGNKNTDGSYNSFFGNGAGFENRTGSRNSFLGARSGFINTEGSDNTFVGMNAGSNNTIGNFNTFVGGSSGFLNSAGSQNTAIGYNSRVADGLTGSTAIGAFANVTRSASLVLGSGVNVGIGNTAPRTLLHLTGGKIYVEANGQGVILKSPAGSCFELTISNAGALTTAPIICP